MYQSLALLALLFTLQTAFASEEGLCIQCHEREVRQWQDSQHALAMQPVTPESILGNFDNGRFIGSEIEARFYREGERYRVALTESGQEQIWTVRYVLGIYPLQQYLIEIGDGKLQALNIAWDSREGDAGGQRWFRLDNPDHQKPGDPLHWRGVYQNWNSMCADCHTTGLSKNYLPQEDRYDTRFEQINVSCGACHADSLAHAQAAERGRSLAAGADLKAKGTWLTGTLEDKPRHVGTTSSAAQVETCGRCHALRTRLDQTPNGRMHDQYSLNRLLGPLYFADGRVREEVFVLGSFLQSKMHQAGVVCSNCHNPHTARPVAEGNALCGQCHALDSFDRPEHHHHPVDSAGAQCVGCHMPQRTYMQVDPRREHNFTTPDPLTAKRADSPDPCLACHAEQTREWAIQQYTESWPAHRERSDWFDIQRADLPAMSAFIADQGVAPIYRASLLEQQAPILSRNAPEVVLAQLSAPDPLLRESAWKAAVQLPARLLKPHAATALQDRHLTVRLAAFEALMLLDALPADIPEVRKEYEAYLQQQSDRPAGRALAARYAAQSGDAGTAERELKIALRMDNAYGPAYLLLTNLLREQKRFDAAIDVLTTGIKYLPQDANLWHLRGLTRLQSRQMDAALEDLANAWRHAPENADFGYRYALALFHTGHTGEARAVTIDLTSLFPENQRIKQLHRALVSDMASSHDARMPNKGE